LVFPQPVQPSENNAYMQGLQARTFASYFPKATNTTVVLERRKFIATACRHFWQRSELEIFSFRAFSLHVP
jgi:hypothetical protein